MSPSHWHCVNPEIGLWETLYTIRGAWVCRTTALRLREGEWLIFNPGSTLSEAAMRELESWGQPVCLLAPNHFHHLGIRLWQKRYPNIALVASTTAAQRLARLGYANLQPLEILESRIPSYCALLQPAGTKNGEVWLRLQQATEVIWVVGDAFLNVTHLEDHWRGKCFFFLLRLLNIAPGLKIVPTWRWLALSHRKDYCAWVLRQLAQTPPTLLIPAHGELICDRNLPVRLSSLIRQLEA